MADRRTLVSYDDIAAPQAGGPAQIGPPLPSTHQPPAKKRRTHTKAPPRRNTQHVQHWDDPGNDANAMNYGGGEENEGHEEYAEEEEESRYLTQEEIWDDSALIDAWNSATAEYEAYHGKSKKWKEEPVKRSPLWYNVPPSPSKLANGKGKGKDNGGNTAAAGQAHEGTDSKPLDFNTFVPSHDPGLAAKGDGENGAEPSAQSAQSYLPGPSGAIASQDEAFEKALNAMYWSGYWTAVYHYHRHYQSQGNSSQSAEGDNEGEDEADEADATMDDLIETQR